MDLVGRAAKRFGSAPAIMMKGKSLSFLECDERARHIAGLLCKEGFRAGDIVALLSVNTPELVITLLGLLKAGMIAAPLNSRFPEELIRTTVQNLRPKLLLTGSSAQLLYFGCRTSPLTSLLEDASRFAAGESMVPPEEMSRPVTIIHTSASSGKAKAAVHTFANHWYSALGSEENLPFGPGDCWLLSLPLYHIGGYALLFRAFVSGGCLAIAESDEPLASSLGNFPLTHLSLVPTQLYRLLAQSESALRLSRLKAVLLGGSSAPKSLLEESVRQHIPLYLSYGSTEMSSQIATTPGPINSPEQNSGMVLPWRELRKAADGELLVRGATLFSGYLTNRGIQLQTDSEGWFHTSDIGTLSEEGVVTVIGRKDNMFISGGENIHPEEIEKALMMIEGIREAVVVPIPDREYGERPVAFIESEEENAPDEGAINLAMNSGIGKLKSPVRYCRVEAWRTLPGSQKIDRGWYKLQALPISRSSGA
ncbi:o-succinylbenzoate--CoA ligase [Chlorobium sp. BLA1]|uniref:o-succinylbenzoate--CoA ligase n=1 Tax=Candidatus Chlorobium masyuteum TaxID=2716876 RepID=UPI0014233FDD|nr:o-succinylbenzoate--CoA ligase [Candidatus Chlorobium masyuteum]NHQ59992.1 o-succinylbenzoate--CoA ligase [Candidatus Chlorobium masyuteum]